MFGGDQEFHLLRKKSGPQPGHVFTRPRRRRQEAAGARQAAVATDLPKQARKGEKFPAQHQRQQYGHEVLNLRLAEAAAKRHRKVAQTTIQAYQMNDE